MIKIEKTEVVGLEAALRGMRNPKNSWDKSDSNTCAFSEYGANHCNECPHVEFCNCDEKDILNKTIIGPNDHDLSMRLAKGGRVHAKYRRYIDVYLDITAPLYWWKEFKTYRKGRKFLDDEDLPFDGMMDAEAVEDFIEMNSCSTMHKIHEKEFTLDDFSSEHLCGGARNVLKLVIEELNTWRDLFLKSKNKDDWWQMIQLLPSSYNQTRTVKLNYEVLANMYKWIESLPYSELIICEKKED